MRPFFQVVGVAIAAFVFTSAAQQVGPYKVIKAEKEAGTTSMPMPPHAACTFRAGDRPPRRTFRQG